jgi:hypothetical protein
MEAGMEGQKTALMEVGRCREVSDEEAKRGRSIASSVKKQGLLLFATTPEGP